MIRSAKARAALGILTSVLFWVGLWWLIAALFQKPLLLPSPLGTLQALLRLAKTGEFYLTLLLSLTRILLGILLALLAGDGGAASLGISLDALPAHNVADAIRYLLQREYTPQDLPEGGADGQLLVLENGSPVWKRAEASHIAVADEAGNFAAENIEAVLAELYALAAAAMPKAGGTFTGAAIDGSANAGEKLRSIAVKTAEAGQAGESVATGGLVLVRK